MREHTRNQYEQAFEGWLIDHGVDYVRADEHKRLGPARRPIKNFDFLLYPGPDRRVIVEVKGRAYRGTNVAAMTGFECWVTRDDVEGLRTWRQVLGAGHEAVFTFAYRIASVDVEFDGREIFAFGRDRYIFFALDVDAYERNMKRRSPRWRTVTLSAQAFRLHAIELSDLLLR
jgi:hypothetical protein